MNTAVEDAPVQEAPPAVPPLGVANDPPRGRPFDFDLSKTPKLKAAILAAQKLIKPVPKSSRNNYSDYSYAGSDAIREVSRAAFHAAGIVFTALESGFDVGEIKGSNLLWVFIPMDLSHVESGETKHVNFPWPIIQDKKPFDKLLSGAITTGQRYFLEGVLQIPKTDSEDMDSRRDPEPDRDVPIPHDEQPPPSDVGQGDWATDAQFDKINALMEQTGVPLSKMESTFGDGKSMSVATANRAINYLEGLLKAKKGGAK